MRISAAAIFAGCAFGATITTTVGCGSSVVLKAGTLCSVNNPSGSFSRASISGSQTISGNTISIVSHGDSVANGALFELPQGASAYLMIVGMFQGIGEGAGLMKVSYDLNADEGGSASSGIDFSFDSEFGIACISAFGGCPSGSFSIPIQLGQPVDFWLTADATSEGSATELGGSDEDIDINIEFFAADGVTPVNAADVPEPASFALAAMAIGLCRSVAERRNSRGSRSAHEPGAPSGTPIELARRESPPRQLCASKSRCR